MKTLKHLCILVLFLYGSLNLFSQVSCTNIDDYTPICVGSNYEFAASTTSANASTTNPGNNYGCLSSSPNPQWYYYKVTTSGSIVIDISNSANTDVDGAIWGPFNSLNDITTQCNSFSAPIDCDYSISGTWTFNTNANAGEFYVILITNYSSVATNVTFADGGSTGATECAPDIQVTKTVDNPTPLEGDTVVWTVSAINKGVTTATNLSITDALPVGVTYVSDNAGGSYNQATGVWTIGDLLISTSATLNITTTVNAGTIGTTIQNQITNVSLDQTESNIALDDLSESITIPTCIPSAVPIISGTVYNDANNNGINNTETGVAGVDVLIYEDIDGSGTVTPGDNLVSTQTTDASGNYSYNVVGGTEVTYADDFSGNVFSGTNNNNGSANWANDVWIRDGSSNGSGDVGILTPSDTDNNFPSQLLQLDNNDAGAYRLLDLSAANAAILTFEYDYDSSKMDGGEELIIQIDPENDGTYITAKTITISNSVPDINITSVSIDLSTFITLPGTANTRIRFVTGANNSINKNKEDWWIDNVVVTTKEGETKFVVITDVATHPSNVILTTDNVEVADFSTVVCQDVNNDFGLYAPKADLSLQKTVNKAIVKVGEMIIFTITVTNSGPEEATNVKVKDILPVGLTYVAGSSTIPINTTYDSLQGIWNLSALTILNGQSISIQIAATVTTAGKYNNITEIILGNPSDPDSTPNNGN